MICKFCGTEIAEGSAFCAKCGKPVETLVAAEKSKGEIAPAASENHKVTPPPHPPRKPKSLVTPIVTLILSASGWLYILASNSIEGMKAWFTSSQELQDSVSGSYNYFGNNTSSEELAGNVILIAIMVLFTLLGIVGIVMLIRRLVGKFTPRKKP